LNANEIVKLLSVKHRDDVFVRECKNGPTHDCAHLRLDAWVMKKSWRHPLTIGYEVKVSRSDFLRDEKWRGYLDYCNQFYFVCPHGLIQPEELPERAGLMWVSKTGSRLFIKRKAKHEDVTIPEDLYRYILMSRVRVDAEYEPKSKEKFWADWVKQKKINVALGRSVSRSLKEEMDKKIFEVESLNKTLEQKIDRLGFIRDTISDIGLDKNNLPSTWQVREKLNEIKRNIPSDLKIIIKSSISGLKQIENIINDSEKGDE